MREREWNRIYLIKKYLDPELEQLFTETKKSRELLCKRERDKILVLFLGIQHEQFGIKVHHDASIIINQCCSY